MIFISKKYRSYYTTPRKSFGQTENSERAKLEAEYKRLEALEQRQYSTSNYNNNNNGVYKTVYLVVGFGLLVGIFGAVLYLVGQNSVKRRC